MPEFNFHSSPHSTTVVCGQPVMFPGGDVQSPRQALVQSGVLWSLIQGGRWRVMPLGHPQGPWGPGSPPASGCLQTTGAAPADPRSPLCASTIAPPLCMKEHSLLQAQPLHTFLSLRACGQGKGKPLVRVASRAGSRDTEATLLSEGEVRT